ncbi:Uncharacterized protein HZ326_30172 [Fusarium oxysporum f. sp. albedinis]|nr:Uncharacterized protein HZ326_30172 [Fusarium oxysporum f. sp. albedinis]
MQMYEKMEEQEAGSPTESKQFGSKRANEDQNGILRGQLALFQQQGEVGRSTDASAVRRAPLAGHSCG